LAQNASVEAVVNPAPSTSPGRFHAKDLVALRACDDRNWGRVVATPDEGASIHVFWWQRPGHEGKVTKELPADLQRTSRRGYIRARNLRLP